MHNGFTKRKSLRKTEFFYMGIRLYEWFLRQRYKNISPTGAVFKVKASLILQNLYADEGGGFCASDGSLTKLKKR